MTNQQTIDKYQIIEEIGRGGFAIVYRATDTRMGRQVALKLIHGHYLQEPDFVQRFRQEAQQAAGLHHPNLVTVYDFGEAEGQLFLAMRLITGPSLATLLAEQTQMPLTQALPLLSQLAQALDYLHSRPLVHRDLKPANILLEGEQPPRQVTLTDFGLVRSLENSAQLTQSGATLGTPAYMAPEQADPVRWGEITHLTDVYALGIILYQMLLGRPPFEGETAALLYAHVNTEPAVPLEMISTLGDDLVAVL
ncbi:MAG: serine/threonine protein kinase, partial [Deltaproteobacteria bacterium]|nr:serine/threonine protein kinase [Deltaproteobacteria bacterium]